MSAEAWCDSFAVALHNVTLALDMEYKATALSFRGIHGAVNVSVTDSDVSLHAEKSTKICRMDGAVAEGGEITFRRSTVFTRATYVTVIVAGELSDVPAHIDKLQLAIIGSSMTVSTRVAGTRLDKVNFIDCNVCSGWTVSVVDSTLSGLAPVGTPPPPR